MDLNTTYGYWRVIARHARFTIPEDLERPAFVGGMECPEDLNALTIGQLIELGDAEDANADYRITEVVLGMDRQATDKSRAVDVVPFISWVTRQVKAINRLFEKISHRPTSREKQAGIDKLQFGLFGTLDWFAKRMGISDHDDVLQVPWLRIYKCMEMDNLTQQYEKRLNDIALREAKRRRR